MMIVITEKIPKPHGFGIFVSNLNRKNESALGAVIRHVKTVFTRENRGIE